MNSWKLLSALILTLALTNVLAFSEKRASEEPADDDINEVGGGEIDEEGGDYDPDLSVDGSESEDDEAAEALEALCEALAEDGVDKRSLDKRGFFSNLVNRVKNVGRKIGKFGKKVGNVGRKVIGKIRNFGRRIKLFGKKSVDGNEEDDEEAVEELAELCEALAEDGVDKRSLIKRGFFSNLVNRVKKIGRKVGKFGKKVGNIGRKVIGKIRNFGRRIKLFGKKSVVLNEEENELKETRL